MTILQYIISSKPRVVTLDKLPRIMDYVHME